MSKNIRLILLLASFSLVYAQEKSIIHIQNSDQERVPFVVEVVTEPKDQMKGLMYRKTMPDQYGMLFIMPKPRPTSFWMRNTYIPLDMIFIDENKVIVDIHTRMDVLSDKPTVINKPIKYVFEINAGEAKSLGIEEGSQVDVSKVEKAY